MGKYCVRLVIGFLNSGFLILIVEKARVYLAQTRYALHSDNAVYAVGRGPTSEVLRSQARHMCINERSFLEGVQENFHSRPAF